MRAFIVFALSFFVASFALAAPHSVALTWSDSDSAVSGIGYNVYRAPGTCSASSVFSKLTATPITSLSYTDATVSLGNSYCYQVTATLAGGESAPSNSITATVNLPSPPLLSAPQVN